MKEIIGEYLEVELISHREKTNIYLILNRKYNISIGQVKWHNYWRQYCFFPNSETIFSSGCMKDLVAFIDKLMEEHKNG